MPFFLLYFSHSVSGEPVVENSCTVRQKQDKEQRLKTVVDI